MTEQWDQIAITEVAVDQSLVLYEDGEIDRALMMQIIKGYAYNEQGAAFYSPQPMPKDRQAKMRFEGLVPVEVLWP